MKYFNIKSAWLCARADFTKWLLNPRMIILAALAVFVYVMAVEPLNENAGLMGKPLNAIEPYIAALNSGSLLLIIPLGFLAISSDFPRIDGASMLGIFRTGRANWFIGQLILLFMMCAAYLAFIFAVSVLPTAFCADWNTKWSDVALKFSAAFPEQSQNFGALLLPKNLFNQLSVSKAAGQSTAFVFAYLFALGMNLMCFTIIGRKRGGVLICGGLIAAGSALCSIRARLMWAFPMANSIVWLHFTEFRREQSYPTAVSIVYFAVIIIALAVLSGVRLRNFDCSSDERE